MIEIFAMTQRHKLWNATTSFAENCSWKAGRYLAELMKQNNFLESDDERAIFPASC